MSELLELAERCEQATGPDDMIDYAIARLRDSNGKVLRQEYYTASFDAAMTLKPNSEIAMIEAFRAALDKWVVESGKTETFPRFLSAAFLRARAATKGEGDKP